MQWTTCAMPPEKLARNRAACIFSLGFLALLIFGNLPRVRADFLDDANRALSWNAFNGDLRLQISGTLDLEEYYVDQPPPGLIFSGQHELFNPRLTVNLDAQLGSQIYAFVQARADRGYRPVERKSASRWQCRLA